MSSNSFAGIAPSSAPAFIAAEVLGGLGALALIKALYPGVTPAEAGDVVVPHPTGLRNAETIGRPSQGSSERPG